MTGRTSTLNASVLLAMWLLGIAAPVRAQAGQSAAPSAAVTDDQVQEAATAVAQANGYPQLIAAITKYKTALASQRARAIVEQRLRNAAPADLNEKRLLLILAQLFTDTGRQTAETAAGRYLVRLIGMGAMTTGDSDQLQRLLLRYYEFAASFTPDLIKPALAEPQIDWPPALPRLMTEFVDDWRGMGAREASRSFADALHATIDDPTGELAKSRDQSLIGQWYATQRGLSGQPEDTNLILTKSGVARTYVQTGGPEDFEGIAAGRWMTAGDALIIKWDDGQVTTGRYSLANGQLQWTALGVTVWVRK